MGTVYRVNSKTIESQCITLCSRRIARKIPPTNQSCFLAASPVICNRDAHRRLKATVAHSPARSAAASPARGSTGTRTGPFPRQPFLHQNKGENYSFATS